MSSFEQNQRQRNCLSWRTKVAELAAAPYPDDDIIKVPIRFGDIRAVSAALARLTQAAADLRAVGDDYPGSSCHKWCHERADAASAGEAGTATTVEQGVVHEHATGAAGDAQSEDPQ